jgi:outer membrane protein OmpA-like peptidoglycan-associated protein
MRDSDIIGPRATLSRRLAALGLALLASAFAAPARAETGVVDLHLEAGPAFSLAGWQRQELGVGAAGRGAVELSLAEWVGIEASAAYVAFFQGDQPDGYAPIDRVSAVMIGLGARFRPLNDEGGYLLPWGPKPSHVGNAWGNLWLGLDAGWVRTGGLDRFGCAAGAGYEFSLVNGLQVGPFARASWVPQPDTRNGRDSADAWMLVAGLSFTVAIPPGIRAMADTDGDGFFDPLDGCPERAEDQDGFADDDGCPDPDNDADGVPDTADKCPLEPEDRDGFKDYDGCPDPDNDADGILDATDKCPNEPEDKDGFEDDDGCPDPDNDGDGFLDAADKCPNEPETVNGLDDDDGCPDVALVEVKDRQILGGERIFFDLNMSRIKSTSRQMLEQLVRLLEVHPEYQRILIQGHADKSGEERFNRELSRKRAAEVMQYLVRLGVNQERLEIEGAGDSSPWQTGKTREERAKNRRVEFYIVQVRHEPVAPAPPAPEVNP